VIGEGGDFEQYVCGACSTIVAVDGAALLAPREVLMPWLEVRVYDLEP
jgi:hypothetical protein